MNNWLLINLAAVPVEVAEAQQALANHPGACHDGVNTVYTWISQEAAAIAVTLPDDIEDEAAYIGQHLATQSAPLIAPKAVLSALFRTPAWRLWCANYGEDTAQFVADKAELGLPPALTQEQAREAVYAMFAGV